MSNNVWVVKANNKPKKGHKGWHWERYFSGEDKGIDWGGPEWITSYSSLKIIREKIAPRDLVVAYQVDEKAILGLTRMNSHGRAREGSQLYNTFDLISRRNSLHLRSSISLYDLDEFGTRPKCFKPGSQGTIFRFGNSDLNTLLKAIEVKAPADKIRVDKWLGLNRDQENGSVRKVIRSSVKRQSDELDQMLEVIERKMAKKDGQQVRKYVERPIRKDAPLVRTLKEKYGHACQFPGCTFKIIKKDGSYYCEVADLHPVSKGEESTRINLIVLCPNHHKMIDLGNFELITATRQRLNFKLDGQSHLILR
jgi:hypothetical protein